MVEGFKKEIDRYREFLSRLVRIRTAFFAILFLCAVVISAIFAPYIAPYNFERVIASDRLLPVSEAHILGTDYMGRDIFSRILYGIRWSFIVSLLSVGLALMLGVPIGLIAGFHRGIADEISMRSIDILMAFPDVLLALFVIATIGPGLINCAIALGIVYTPIFARLVRGVVLSIRELSYVEAAKSIGETAMGTMIREILPNCMAPILVQATLVMSYAILAEAFLSFLGLGVIRPDVSLGMMVADGRPYLKSAPWVIFFPGITIMAIVLTFNLIGDGLRDVFDVRLRV